MHAPFTSTRQAAQGVRAHGLPCVLLVSLVLNVVQAERMRSLSGDAPTGLARGTMVPPLRLTSHTGTTADLFDAASHTPTIVYYFAGACRWCERNWDNAVALERATRGRYRFIAVAAKGEDVTPVASGHALEFDLYPSIDGAQRRALGLTGTPQVVVLSPEGRVLDGWVGAFSGRTLQNVEGYFGVKLPGLTERGNDRPRERGAGAPRAR